MPLDLAFGIVHVECLVTGKLCRISFDTSNPGLGPGIPIFDTCDREQWSIPENYLASTRARTDGIVSFLDNVLVPVVARCFVNVGVGAEN